MAHDCHGNLFMVRAPGSGVMVHVAGIDRPDGSHHGVGRIPEDPEVAGQLCVALTS
jgi:hypothetical protein